MTPKVTIGIPFRNPGPYLQLAVKSVLAQDFQDWELILLDDGSMDGSTEFARDLTDPRVRFISDGLHQNLNVRLNQMARLARAPYLFRMDADDVMHPERLSAQYAVLLDSDPNSVVGTKAYVIDKSSKVLGMRAKEDEQKMGLGARHSFTHPTVAARTKWFLANPYSENFVFHRAQDAELWCRTSSHTRFITIQRPLLFYRELGVFSVSKYLGTGMGVLALFNHYASKPAWAYPVMLARELAKIYVRLCLVRFGFEDLIERRSMTRLPTKKLTEAQKILDLVASITLPEKNRHTNNVGLEGEHRIIAPSCDRQEVSNIPGVHCQNT